MRPSMQREQQVQKHRGWSQSDAWYTSRNMSEGEADEDRGTRRDIQLFGEVRPKLNGI